MKATGSTVDITDSNGNVTDTFKYDTYGKLTGRTGTSEVIFGYNGRDGVITDDNGLIYMRARYYSPAMKRFINADVLAGDISNVVTLNRYAYANGNPVSLVDPLGLEAERGGTDYDMKYSESEALGGHAVTSGPQFLFMNPLGKLYSIIDWGKMAKDIINYDKNNTDEQKVLDSHYFSSYKGKFVIRTNMLRSGSFGVLFITHEEDKRWDKIETVKHEYGHTIQLKQMGPVAYSFFIVLPSAMELGTKSYYRKPWEITADMFGGVDLNLRTSDDALTQEHIEDGKEYWDIASDHFEPLRPIKLIPYYFE